MSRRDSRRPGGPAADGPRKVGRYLLFDEIAAGGMASVHVAQLVGAVGFSRIVAVKRLLPHFGDDPEFLAMFRDEARIAARIRHPNVVPLLDVVADGNELFLVMDYVEGESLSNLLRATSSRGALAPREIVLAIMYGTLQGLHAAHEARSETGELLHVVHRDVSPQNILVGADGTPRVLDFGIAKAVGRLARTQVGHVKGKFGYMAPEQLGSGGITRRTDVYGASVVLWEALTGTRLFSGDDTEMVRRVLEGQVPRPRQLQPGVPGQLERIVMRGLARDPEKRYPTALEMAEALHDLGGMASSVEVGEWAAAMAADTLSKREAILRAIESRDAPLRRKTAPPSNRNAPAVQPAEPGDRTASATFHTAPGDRTASATFHTAPGDSARTATIGPGANPGDDEGTTVVERIARLRHDAVVAWIVLAGAALLVALVVLLVVLLHFQGGEATTAAASARPAPPAQSASAGATPAGASAAASAAPTAASPAPAQDGSAAPTGPRVRPHVAPPPSRRRPTKPKRENGMPDFGI